MDDAGSGSEGQSMSPAERLEQNRREGRGRLSAIDMLPDEAEPAVVWALDQLRDRKLPQNVIFAEFNEKLGDLGIAPISKSSWSRFAVRKAMQFRKLDEVQRMSAELVGSLGVDGPDQVTVAVAEMLKLAVFQHLEGDVTTKGLRELSGALQAAVSAQKNSAEFRRQLTKERDDEARKQAAQVEAIGKKAGVSAETLAEINRVLGVG